MSKFVESTVRISRLYCSDCKKKIKINDIVIFKLAGNNNKMEEVYCSSCSTNYEEYLNYDDTHPFDLD